jgi:RNA 2',3'-cyclic 3'-phosphodiesterase
MSDAAATAIPSRRLFFALWPDDDLRRRIEDDTRSVIEESQGRPTNPRNFHVTVLFVGDVPATTVTDALAAAHKITAPGFDLVLDQIETFVPSRVLCLTSSHAPRELLGLADGLRFSLLARQIKLKQQELRPHVTLARNSRLRGAPRSSARYAWQVTEFVLAESIRRTQGSDYEIIGRWPLHRV